MKVALPGPGERTEEADDGNELQKVIGTLTFPVPAKSAKKAV